MGTAGRRKNSIAWLLDKNISFQICRHLDLIYKHNEFYKLFFLVTLVLRPPLIDTKNSTVSAYFDVKFSSRSSKSSCRRDVVLLRVQSFTFVKERKSLNILLKHITKQNNQKSNHKTHNSWFQGLFICFFFVVIIFQWCYFISLFSNIGEKE